MPAMILSMPDMPSVGSAAVGAAPCGVNWLQSTSATSASRDHGHAIDDGIDAPVRPRELGALRIRALAARRGRSRSGRSTATRVRSRNALAAPAANRTAVLIVVQFRTRALEARIEVGLHVREDFEVRFGRLTDARLGRLNLFQERDRAARAARRCRL